MYLAVDRGGKEGERERVISVEQKSNPMNSTFGSNPESGTSVGTRQHVQGTLYIIDTKKTFNTT